MDHGGRTAHLYDLGMNPRRLIQIGLGYLTLSNLQLGLWALLAPRSFYDGFPGLGRGWISVDGPYNEHLIRDFGALNLSLAVVFISAIVSMNATVIRTSCAAALVWGIPHFVYHFVNTDGLTTGDVVASLGGLAFFAVIPVAVLLWANRLDDGDVSTQPLPA